MTQNRLPRAGETGGAARRGAALLSGLLRCGRCGRKLQVRYRGREGQVARYHCRGDRGQPGSDTCLSLGSLRADAAVVAELLAAVEPAGIAAACEAAILIMAKAGGKQVVSTPRLWGSLGVALGCLCGAYQQALGWPWVASRNLLSGFSFSAFQLLLLGWLGGPGTCLWSCKGPDLWEIPGKIAIVRIAACEASQQTQQQEQEKRRAVELALEKARYEAQRAQRQFDAVEPENRLEPV